MNDDELISLAKAGDEGAWRDLYAMHAARLRVWLRTLPTGDASNGHEDLASDAWMIAAERVAHFEGTSSQFAGWLFGIARNLAMNARRRSARRATVPRADTAVEAGVMVEPHDIGVADDDWIQRLLQQLPPRERQVVTCLDVLGLDVNMTATALGVTTNAVRVTHHRALGRLRGLWPADPS